VLEGRAKVSGKVVEQIKKKLCLSSARTTGGSQGHCCFGGILSFGCREVDLGDQMISGQMMLIDNEMQQAS
jgi:hypothetical protein